MRASPFYAFLISALLMAAALPGCSTLSSPSENPWGNLALQYVVFKAVGQYIDNDPAKADKVRDVAMQVTDLIDQNALTTIDLVEQAVRAKIDWSSLAPEDGLVLDALITTLGADLRNRLGEDGLKPDQVVAVRAVMTWVVQAASFTGAELREPE